MSKKNFINASHIEGYLYEHKLERKVTGPNSKNPGTEYIRGDISVAVDNDLMNVIKVHFNFVVPTFNSGKPNATFNVLSNIVDGKTYSVMEHGKENAAALRIDSAIGLTDFYDRNNELVSAKQNVNGFVHVIPANELDQNENKRATFEADFLITGCFRKDADPDKGLPEKMILKGAIFSFQKALLPVELSVLNPQAMDYFDSLEPSNSNPIFTKVRGVQSSQTVVKTITEESAFGEPSVREVKNTYKDFVINWASPEPYLWDDESTILASELAEAISEREIYLATLKKRNEDWQNQKNTTPNVSIPTPAKGTYDF
jgi:hypothetical protein